jgi:S-phase kinase-associated protein 1
LLKRETVKEFTEPIKEGVTELSKAGVSDWFSKFIKFDEIDYPTVKDDSGNIKELSEEEKEKHRHFFLFNMVLAARYLDIEMLQNLAVAEIAIGLGPMSVEEIRDLFGIENDFTPEEEKAIRDETRWADY